MVNSQKILVVEDNPETQHLILRTLNGSFSEITMAFTIKEAKKCMETKEFQLILLDIQLPDGDGLQFCNELQSNPKTRAIPIMFLTGQRKITDKVTAFAMGADDYIEKPFNPLELKARVEGKLKKRNLEHSEQNLLVRGALRLDALSQRVWIVDHAKGIEKPLDFTSREFKLLFHLAKTEERVYSRAELLDAIWGNESDVFDRTIDSHISAIRKKLAEFSVYIESISGQGYRFSSSMLAKSA